ncbi:MAG: DNA methyltransferase [Armatimonadota bacterium]|nr:DNA methyltransferase [Armatimonadota bacterium]
MRRTTSKPDLSYIAEGLRPLAVPIDAPKIDPSNARRHPERNLQAVRASLRRYGQRKPIVVNRRTAHIEAGNLTWEVARQEGWRYIAALYVDDDPSTASGYAIADNRTAELAEWDDTRLQETLQALKTEGQMEFTGFDTQDLEAIVRRLRSEADDGFDVQQALAAAPDLGVQVKRGQVYALGAHRLMCGDATSEGDAALLMRGQRAAMVWTDPPYGVSYEPRSGRHKSIEGDEKRLDELGHLVERSLKIMVRCTDPRAAFYIWHATITREIYEQALKAAGLHEHNYLVWSKPGLGPGYGDYRWAYEPCFYAAKDGQQPAFHGDRAEPNVWTVSVGAAGARAVALGPGVLVTDGGGRILLIQAKRPTKRMRSIRLLPGERLSIEDGAPGQTTVWEIARETRTAHPTQKPVELALRAIENSSRPGEIVLDLFLGSGTTLMAAERAGRRCFGMDVDPKWCAVAIARWEAATGQSAVLEQEPGPARSARRGGRR